MHWQALRLFKELAIAIRARITWTFTPCLTSFCLSMWCAPCCLPCQFQRLAAWIYLTQSHTYMMYVNSLCHTTGNTCEMGPETPIQRARHGTPRPALPRTDCHFYSPLKAPQPLHSVKVIETPFHLPHEKWLPFLSGHVCLHFAPTCGGRRSVFRSWLSPSTMWGPGVEPRLSGSVTSTFTTEAPTLFPSNTPSLR